MRSLKTHARFSTVKGVTPWWNAGGARLLKLASHALADPSQHRWRRANAPPLAEATLQRLLQRR